MKKVLLLGDSIRMGYDEFVEPLLNQNGEDYKVYYDETDNGRFITYTIWQFNYLNNQFGPFDIVHFNTGYWDMNREGPKKEPETPLDDYEKSLRRLISLIRETGAKPVFATTIPICDKIAENKENNPAFQKINYRNAWVLEYNDRALKVMQEEDVKVNDLYSLLLTHETFYKCPDSLHLIQEGYELCAKQVSEIIKKL